MKSTLKPLIAVALLLAAGTSALSAAEAVFRTAAAANADPFAAGKTAAEALRAALNGNEPQVVLLAECFEDKEDKDKVLAGVATVFARAKICGGSTYGAYTQAGALDRDAVALLAIGGDAVRVRTTLVEKMGAAGLSLENDQERLTTALRQAGARLAGQLPDVAKASLLLVIADAHSPKNQLLLDGIQSVAGTSLPVTGGSVNKNAGQNWVYHQGKAYTDSAVALELTGPIKVAQAGRQAKDNDAVIATATDGSAAALKQLGIAPAMVVAFDCAGRMGKLKNVGDELSAIQQSVGRTVPIFGLFCAGEFGPSDNSDAPAGVCVGRGWHVMVSALAEAAASSPAAAPATTRGIIDAANPGARPADAVTLVGPDGYNLVPEGGKPTKWVFADGVLTASPDWDSVITRETYQDLRMHVEFNVNEVKDAKDPEADGNSGIYIQQRYEIQILNSFGVPPADYKPSYCGSIYRQKKPDRFVSKKAGEWQSFDIVFRAARFDGEKKTENARITVYQNGELIHDDYAITGKTGVGQKEGPEPRPVKLQGHHNPVRFRNVWIQRLALGAQAGSANGSQGPDQGF